PLDIRPRGALRETSNRILHVCCITHLPRVDGAEPRTAILLDCSLSIGRPSEIARFVGTKVEFGADRDEFALNGDARELPLIHADPYLNDLLLKYCEAPLADRRDDIVGRQHLSDRMS